MIEYHVYYTLRQPVREMKKLARFGFYTFVALLFGSFTLAQSAQGQSPPTDPSSTLDNAIAILAEARLHFKEVRDYECRLTKRERINGVMLPEETIAMKVRNKPFSVYLYCESPKADKGLEVSYVEGRNEGKMRVHPVGIAGIFGFVTLEPHDSRAMEKNRHCITEAGFGNLLDRTAKYWDMERRLNKTLVRITEEELTGRACTRIETIHPDRSAGSFYGYRSVLWLDKSTHLPVGAETYDWPRRGGPEGGDLLESYRFLDIRCNIGLGDEAFPQ